MTGKPVLKPVLSDLERNILDASLEEFRRKGFHQAGVDAIADKLKIGKGTIYRHFGNKLLLFLSVLNFYLDKAVDAAKSVLPIEDFEKSFSVYMDRLFLINSEIGEFLLTAGLEEGAKQLERKLKGNSRIRRSFQELVDKRQMGITILAGILNKGKELGRLGKNFNSEIQAEIIVSTVNNYIREYSSACALNSSLGLERKYELAVGLAELKNFIARGLGLEQERKR